MFNCFVTCSFSFRLLLVLCCLFRNAGKTQQISNSPRSWIVMLQREDFEKWLFQQKFIGGLAADTYFCKKTQVKWILNIHIHHFDLLRFKLFKKNKTHGNCPLWSFRPGFIYFGCSSRSGQLQRRQFASLHLVSGPCLPTQCSVPTGDCDNTQCPMCYIINKDQTSMLSVDFQSKLLITVHLMRSSW